MRFIAFLYHASLSLGTIKVYLAGVRSWYLTTGLPIPVIYTPRVKLALRSILRDNPPPSRVLPLTFSILQRAFSFLTPTPYNIMCLAAMSLAYFACLRSAEYCFDASLGHSLSTSDITFLSSPPRSMRVLIRSSKTLIHGFEIVIGCSGVRFCAVCLIRLHLSTSNPPPQLPLFKLPAGVPLNYRSLSAFIKALLTRMGLDPARYSPHSLRAGSATDAAALGASSHFIQSLGRWRSDAYLAYLRPTPLFQSSISPFLASVIT